jgi:endo-1,3(4)-beta-glucanase
MKNNLILYLSTVIFLLIGLNINAQGTCITTSNTAAQGSLSVGIKTTYETLANGTDVTITFELLDVDKTVDIAYLWNPDPNFSETQMTNVGVNTFAITLNSQTGIITKACKMVINGGGQIVSNYIDYEVNTDCSATNDVIAPDTFIASVGASTAFSVELLLNANDASGTILYRVTYNAIEKAISAPAGTQKSFLITGLDPLTDYNFNVTASDLSGNQAANNPIPLSASTLEDTSTDCEGTSADTQQGTSFSIGYNYSFVTQGNDVEFTFELLDTDKVGVVAYLWRAPPDFLETQMDNVPGTSIFTKIVTNQSMGETVSYACKFAYQGGLSITKYFSYEVGSDCLLSIDDFETNAFKVFPNPTNGNWNISSSLIINTVVVYDVLGKRVMSLTPNANEIVIDTSSLKSGMYFARVENINGIKTVKLIKE